MKTHFLLVVIGAVLLVAPGTAFAEDPVAVDVLYMNHGPLQPTLRELRALFPQYGDKITVSWYDVESAAGERFKAQQGIRRHTPLVIWVDGRSELVKDGRTLKFEGFPTGSGPSFFQGKWKLADLAAILDQETGKN
ncbi:MAG: hypothetical protein P8010_09495 [Desulfosarcinaceae bacterium]|jgi:hypothetical protein